MTEAPKNQQKVKGRFEHVRYDEASMAKSKRAYDLVTDVEAFINDELGGGRYQALALTGLEEVFMWIGKAIRDNQVAAAGPRTEYQKELHQLIQMFPNGCPHCPCKLPPDPRDGRCGMCGAQLVERKAVDVAADAP